jgi:hypothetical protein
LHSADSQPYEVLKETAKRIGWKIEELNTKISIAKKEGKKLELRKGFYASVNLDNLKEIEKDKVAFWFQGFTCTWCKKHIQYGKDEIQAQIQGIESQGFNEWLIWNAASRYGDWFKIK